MLLHACRVAKEQDEKERRQEWNREESCIVGITVLSHWWTPSKRSTVIGYRVTTSKRTNDGNQRIQTAVAQLLPSFSSSLLVFFFFSSCSLDPSRPFAIGVKILVTGYNVTRNRTPCRSRYTRSNTLERIRSLASWINRMEWNLRGICSFYAELRFFLILLPSSGTDLDWCKYEVKICN